MQTVAAQVVEHTHDAVITTTIGGIVTLWNPGATRLYGYTAAEARGRPIDFLSLPGDRSAIGNAPSAGSREVTSAVRRHRHRSGEEVLVRLRVTRLEGSGEHQLLLCATDVGDQQRVESDLAASRFAIERGRQEIRRLAGRLLEAQEEERRRLARELHDDIGQRLATLIVDASVLGRDLRADDHGASHDSPRGAAMADRLMRHLQDLSRDVRYLSHQLHPAALDRIGLTAALEAHVAEVEESTGLETRFTVRGAEDPLPTDIALGLFRIAQEALRNVVRHAETRQAHLSLVEAGDEIRLAIADDGVGFDPDEIEGRSLGLASMDERARLLGGHLRLSSAPGAGTEVEAILRLPGDGAGADMPLAAEETGVERPRLIGPYRLLEVLGKGASATVYLAEEPPPLGRQVALKLHRAPLAGHRETLRFKAERQALARLRHPNVAQVYEARTTEDGDPYIVMEYVPGIAITTYCDRYRLDLRRRLELFLGVCEGVQHAHQKGILHRDLKPDNVLVTEDEGRAQPKIIDFGVAKGIDQPLAEGTVWIEDGAAAGTLGYASPEALEGDDIDTRSDVWSLGVMLHELLIGGLPGNEPALEGRRFLALPAAERQTLAAARATSPRALSRSLHGDLEWITMKALATEPAARYNSAAALAEDLARHLHDEPVEAGPPSLGYRLGRFLHRNRSEIRSGALVLFSLAGGFYATLRRSRKAARDAATAERVTEFLVELFETPSPVGDRGDDLTVSQILQRGVGRVASELSGRPRARAELLYGLGVTYSMLGLHDDAKSLLEEALALRREIHGDEHPEVAECLVGLGNVHFRGDAGDPVPFYREALAIREKLFGVDHPTIVEPLHSLGVVHAGRNQPDAARTLLERTLAIQEEAVGPGHLEVAKTLHNLASPAFFQQRFDDAEALMRRALAIRENALPPAHPHLAGNHLALAFLYQTQERWRDAEASVGEALEILEKIRGAEHPEVTLARLLRDQVKRTVSDPALAEDMFLRAPAIRERALAPDHPQAIGHVLHLANLLRDLGRQREAEPLYRRVLELCRQRQRHGAEESDRLLAAGSDYAELLRRTGREDEAAALVRKIAHEG